MAATGVALGLLGREVLGRAHDRAGLRHLGGPGAGDAEVRDLRVPGVVDDHVVRLEVAVDHPVPVGEAGGGQDLEARSITDSWGSGACVITISFSVRPGRYSIAM